MFELAIIFTSTFVFVVMVKGLRRFGKMQEFKEKIFDAELIMESKAKVECFEARRCQMFDNLK